MTDVGLTLADLPGDHGERAQPAQLPGWVPRAVLAGVTAALVTVALLGATAVVPAVLIVIAGIGVVLVPGSAACGVLVGALALSMLLGTPQLDLRLAMQAALLPVVHGAAALSGVIPMAARLDRALLGPSLLRTGVAVAVVVPVTVIAAATPDARSSGLLLAVATSAVAAVIVAALLLARADRR